MDYIEHTISEWIKEMGVPRELLDEKGTFSPWGTLFEVFERENREYQIRLMEYQQEFLAQFLAQQIVHSEQLKTKTNWQKEGF